MDPRLALTLGRKDNKLRTCKCFATCDIKRMAWKKSEVIVEQTRVRFLSASSASRLKSFRGAFLTWYRLTATHCLVVQYDFIFRHSLSVQHGQSTDWERIRLVKDTEKTTEKVDVSHGANAKKICKNMSRSLAIEERIFRKASGMIENL